MRIGRKLKNVKFMLVRNLIFFDFSDSQNLNDLWVTEKKRKVARSSKHLDFLSNRARAESVT